jgi:hypothetical protein
MVYKVLADGVVAVHFLWILFLIFGGVWGIRYRLIKLVHIPALVFAFFIEIFDWYCPLTHLEVWLRGKHDRSLAYAGSFIIRHLERLVYLDVDRRFIVCLTIMLCGFNGWLYFGRKHA